VPFCVHHKSFSCNPLCWILFDSHYNAYNRLRNATTMQFSSCASFVLRVLLVGLIIPLAIAFPALSNSDPEAKPASLLGRSYTRRAADSDSPAFLASRRLAWDTSAQLDSHSPLGRADRFQIAQRRTTNAPHSLRAVDKNEAQSGDEGGSMEGREILLSHQQGAPVPLPISTSSLSSIAPVATPTPTFVAPPPPPQSTAPSSHSRVAHKSKSKPKKTVTSKSKHNKHKPDAALSYPSAE
ncbi:hypothetical protein K438DRAFT_899912, partial [Mycena galopus ATCC 62051]